MFRNLKESGEIMRVLPDAFPVALLLAGCVRQHGTAKQRSAAACPAREGTNLHDGIQNQIHTIAEFQEVSEQHVRMVVMECLQRR